MNDINPRTIGTWPVPQRNGVRNVVVGGKLEDKALLALK